VTELPFEDNGWGTQARRGFGLVIALLLHAGAAWGIAQIRPIERVKELWLEMTVLEPEAAPPPPPPLPEPEVKPDRSPKPLTPVDFQKTVEEPPPEAQPVEENPVEQPVRRVQGLSASSFAPGSASGFSVRAGTSMRTGATDDLMSLDEAIVPYSAATVQPKIRSKPPMVVPEAARLARIEGVIEVLVDLDEEGSVLSVRVLSGLGAAIDEACVQAWKQASFKPAMQGDRAVGVRNAPYRCRVEAVQ
jgi:TonB family protein